MRLREATLWRDAPEWYLPPPPPAWGEAPRASRNPRRPAAEPAAGFVTLRLSLPPELLRVPRIKRGALPLHHLRLMHHQLQQVVATHPSAAPLRHTPFSCALELHPLHAQLRNGLFVSRLLGRALVLPEACCSYYDSCELHILSLSMTHYGYLGLTVAIYDSLRLYSPRLFLRPGALLVRARLLAQPHRGALPRGAARHRPAAVCVPDRPLPRAEQARGLALPPPRALLPPQPAHTGRRPRQLHRRRALLCGPGGLRGRPLPPQRGAAARTAERGAATRGAGTAAAVEGTPPRKPNPTSHPRTLVPSHPGHLTHYLQVIRCSTSTTPRSPSAASTTARRRWRGTATRRLSSPDGAPHPPHPPHPPHAPHPAPPALRPPALRAPPSAPRPPRPALLAATSPPPHRHLAATSPPPHRHLAR